MILIMKSAIIMLSRLAYECKFTSPVLKVALIIISIYQTVKRSILFGRFYFSELYLLIFCIGAASLAFGIFLTIYYRNHKEEVDDYNNAKKIYDQLDKTTDGLKQISRKNRK